MISLLTTTILSLSLNSLGCWGARWPSGLERWTGDRTVRGSNPTAKNFSLRNFGNSVYPALPVSFGGDTKSRRSLLSGVYARGSKKNHQSALECVTVMDSTTHSKLPQKCVYAAENAALHWKRRRRRRRRSYQTDFIDASRVAGARIFLTFAARSSQNTMNSSARRAILFWQR